MRPTTSFVVVAISIHASGCVDSFAGSNVQVDLDPTTVVQARVNPNPLTPMAANEIAADSHFLLYGLRDGATPLDTQVTEILRFEVRRMVDVTSPCFIDVGDRVPYPGIHVGAFLARVLADTGIMDPLNPPDSATEEQKIRAATAAQRAQNIARLGNDNVLPTTPPTVLLGVRALVSASQTKYPAMASSCDTTSAIPPPSCNDDASNALRLRLCQEAWAADSSLWEGTDRVLTEPLNGTTYGMVRGINPINLSPIGGAQFFVEDPVTNFDRFAIFHRLDEPPVPTMGTAVVAGNPSEPTRGVTHVLMVGAPAPGGTGPQVTNLAIFENVGRDQVHF